jgi:hypothetical protein
LPPEGGKEKLMKVKENTEDEILQAVFDGEIATLKGILELCGIGVPMEEARPLVYRAAVLGSDRRMLAARS